MRSQYRPARCIRSLTQAMKRSNFFAAVLQAMSTKTRSCRGHLRSAGLVVGLESALHGALMPPIPGEQCQEEHDGKCRMSEKAHKSFSLRQPAPVKSAT